MLGDECFCVFLKCVFGVVTFGKIMTIARLITFIILERTLYYSIYDNYTIFNCDISVIGMGISIGNW